MAPVKNTKAAQQQKAPQQKAQQQKASQQKRQAQESKQQPPAKKPKENSLLTAVTDGLQSAATLPDACRQMITALARNCLVVPVTERHEIHNWAVKVVGEALYGEKHRLEASLQADVEKLTTAEAERASWASKVCATDKELAEVLVTKQTREADHKAAAEVASAGNAKLAEAEEAHRACSKEREELQEHQVALQAAMARDFTALQDGACETGQMAVHVDALLAVARKGGLDATLESVLPSALSKNMCDRGDFDKLAVSQFEESMTKREQELVAAITSGEGRVADASSAIEAVKQEICAEIENERLAASALAAAQSASEQAQQRVQEANAGSADFETRYKEAIKSRDHRRATLEQFEALTISCFETLRTPPAQAVAEDQVETATGNVEPPAEEVSVPIEASQSQVTSPETPLEVAEKSTADEGSVSFEAQVALGGQ